MEEIHYDDHETVTVIRRMRGMLPIFVLVLLSCILLLVLWLLHVPAIRCMRLRFPFQDGKQIHKKS